VSNIVQFPVASTSPPRSAAHVGARLLSGPPAHAHAVQFYDDEAFLFETVGLFVRSALEAGDAAVIIATPAHTDGILNQLGKQARERALKAGQLVLIDAEAMLARFMLNDLPAAEPFFESIDRLLTSLAATLGPGQCIRAFGEMVDILWRQGKRAAAIELEKLWGQFSKTHELRLLCAYTMRDFYKSEDSTQFGELCQLHTHVLPTERFTLDDGDGFARLRDISLLEQRAQLLDSEVQYREELEGTLREALAARSRLEFELQASVQREREARLLVGASETFNEVLVCLLDPLETLLTTCRLLTQSRETPLDSAKIERLAAGGARLQRLLEQLVAMTQNRLALGVSVLPRLGRDVASLVRNVVEVARQQNPRPRIELAAAKACFAPVDLARLRQALIILIRHATEHGDANSPITVEVAEQGPEVKVRVHHYGPPVAKEWTPSVFRRPSLFQPQRPASPDAEAELGSSLDFAERVVVEHGGRLHVASSLQDGTTLELWLPSCR
jgi:signal transduction histidine kinase